jgi:arylsulfatase A-like enzyme
MIACPLFATEGKVMTQQIRGDSGCHRSEGIFIAHGPGVKSGEILPANSIMDLAPTIMHLMGAPVPQIMDGRVLSEIFTNPSSITYSDNGGAPDLAAAADYSDEESAQVEDRLRSLGYL